MWLSHRRFEAQTHLHEWTWEQIAGILDEAGKKGAELANAVKEEYLGQQTLMNEALAKGQRVAGIMDAFVLRKRRMCSVQAGHC